MSLRSWLMHQGISKRCKKRIGTFRKVANFQSLISSNNSIDSIRSSQGEETILTLHEQISLLLETTVVAVDTKAAPASTALPNHCLSNAPITAAQSSTTADESAWNKDFLHFSQLTSTASSAKTNGSDDASKHSTVCLDFRHARCCKYSPSLCR